MNSLKLKGLLREKELTYKECAEALKMSVTTFNSKINNKTQFDIVEINCLVNFLKLDLNKAIEIFFDNNLHNIQE